jgi:pyruvate/2-oxoglutarate dehydrogenase complex dihydrolipoamide acyltransferase (E2) component
LHPSPQYRHSFRACATVADLQTKDHEIFETLTGIKVSSVQEAAAQKAAANTDESAAASITSIIVSPEAQAYADIAKFADAKVRGYGRNRKGVKKAKDAATETPAAAAPLA